MGAGIGDVFSWGVPWSLLTSLDEVERREFLALARRRTFERRDVLCHAGEQADSLHLVEHGRLGVQVSLPSGASAMINVLGPGDYFGELALLSHGGLRTATISALEVSTTLVVTASAFRRLRESRPSVERTLTGLLSARVDELSHRLIEAMYVGLDGRLLRRLVELCETYGRGQARVVVPLTQSQLADLTGGTRPTVNQVLQRLVDEGLVVIARGRVEVLDVPGLRRRAGL